MTHARYRKMKDLSATATPDFDRNYELHLKHLKLKGLQRKTIEASCGHRHCPHCQHHESQQWLERQLKKQVCSLIVRPHA